MAFESKNLSVLAYANGFTLWHYTTADAAVSGPGYFNYACRMLRVGDMILANVGVGSAVKGGIFLVSANSDGVVSVTDIAGTGVSVQAAE